MSDTCPKCGQSWESHDFGVPEPYCPAPSDFKWPPVPNGTEARVCEDIAARQAKGVVTYGKTVEENPLPLRQWLQHAYEEALDLTIYLKRAMEEMDKHS